MASASRELLAAPDELWAFLAEPRHLADWWPGITDVEPDRRGFAAGARWRVRRRQPQLALLRLPSSGEVGPLRTETLVILELEPRRRVVWQLVGARAAGRFARPLEVALDLRPGRDGGSHVELSVASGAWRGSADAAVARRALDRLYALVQTAGP